MQLLLGVDGGGTRTRLVLADEVGRVLGWGVGGPGNCGSTPAEEVRRHLACACEHAQSMAGMLDAPAAVFLGMAGVTGEQDRERVRQIIEDTPLAMAKRIDIGHDISIALAGGLAGEPGIALIAGTGSSCYGRDAAGQAWQAGGWGHLIDDAGSGYRIALDGLIAAVRGADGRGPTTRLTGVLFDAIGVADLSQIIGRLHAGADLRMTKDQLAAMAPLVIDAAEAGDDEARRILDHAAEELVAMVEAVAARLDFSRADLQVTTTGRVAEASAIAGRLVAALQRRLPTARLVEPRLPPVIGAVLLAMQHAGIPITGDVVANLGRTSPAFRQPEPMLRQPEPMP